MDRRRFLASAGAALGASSLVASSARAQQGSIRFSTPEADPQQIKAWEAIFADFKAAKGVNVQPEYGLWDDLVKKIAADLVAGQPPAIITGGSKPGFMIDLARRGLTVDLTKVIDDIGRPVPGAAGAENDGYLMLHMRELIAGLPQKQREAFCLRYFAGLDYGAIAAVLHCSQTSARANVSHAARKLKAMW